MPLHISKGSLLEAKDSQGTWYPVKVIDQHDDKVLLHFCNWSSRYDAWYPLNSDSLRKPPSTQIRPAVRHKLQGSCLLDQPTRRSIAGTKKPEVLPVGTHVMACWRNNFEYLAEVLAYRHRYGDRLEYRLKYIWDNVIEWCPANRLRQATQFEVNYVLKFCKEHGGIGAGKTFMPPSSYMFNDRTCSTVTRVHRSQPSLNRSPEPSNAVNNNRSHLTTSTDTSPVASTSSCAPRPRRGRPSKSASTSEREDVSEAPLVGVDSVDGIVEQNDMVYDKSVVQFHEACRRRRELKRQTIQTEQLTTVESISNTKLNELGKLGSPVPVSSSTDEAGLDSTEKPAKIRRILDSASVTATDTVDEAKKYTSTKNAKMNGFSGIDVGQTTKQGASDLVKVSTPSTTPPTEDKESCTSQSMSKSDPVQKSSVTVNGTVTSSPPATLFQRKRLKSITGPTAVARKAVPPVAFPCQFCSRCFRQQKLLNAHTANYHKNMFGVGSLKTNMLPHFQRDAPRDAGYADSPATVENSHTDRNSRQYVSGQKEEMISARVNLALASLSY